MYLKGVTAFRAVCHIVLRRETDIPIRPRSQEHQSWQRSAERCSTALNNNVTIVRTSYVACVGEPELLPLFLPVPGRLYPFQKLEAFGQPKPSQCIYFIDARQTPTLRGWARPLDALVVA